MNFFQLTAVSFRKKLSDDCGYPELRKKGLFEVDNFTLSDLFFLLL